MMENNCQETCEYIPRKSKQRSQLAVQSIQDSSPKKQQINEKQNVKISDQIQADKIYSDSEQQQTSLLQEMFAQATGLQKENTHNQIPSQQNINSLTSINENGNIPFSEIQYCKRHSLQYSPSLSNKSIQNNCSSITNNHRKNAKAENLVEEIDSTIDTLMNIKSRKHKNGNRECDNLTNNKNNKQNFENNNQVKNNNMMTMSGSNIHQDDSESSGDSQTSESESNESSGEEYIRKLQQKQLGLTRNKNISSESTGTSCNLQSSSSSSQQQQSQQQSQQYPLQFICVEPNCTEQSKYCCAKCLSSGEHVNHQAICVKTINQQIKQQLKTNKLHSVKQKIDQLFDDLSEKLKQCRESLNTQFNIAYSELQNQTQNALNPNASLEQQVSIWKAFYQSENAIIMEHLSFILEKSDLYFNQIGSRIVNLNAKQLLFVKQHTKYDILFNQQLKSIEDELQKAEQSLSLRAKQALAALPQFNFNNEEFENTTSVALKKFEYPERIEFCQVDKRGEQYGRCLIFWKDGAYRAGYHRGGQSQGVCRMVWENGNVYEGSYVDDCKQGQGFFIKYSDNTSYFGSFEDDAKSGYGIEYYRNNTHYVGEFKNWKTHGKGKLIDTQSKKIISQGQWKYGKFVGEVSEL